MAAPRAPNPRLLVLCSPLQVSSAAFRAFSCEEFDSGRAYLKADWAVECSTASRTSDDHEAAKALAYLGILLYPVGVSLLYVLLLVASRNAILRNQPTALSKALGFLVRDFEPAFMWYAASRPGTLAGSCLTCNCGEQVGALRGVEEAVLGRIRGAHQAG